VDLARQEASRRSRDDDLDPLAVEHAPDEALPARNQLDLVEEPVRGLSSAQGGVCAIVLFQQEPELLHADAGQAVVVEADVHRAFRGDPRPAFGEQLAEECRLAGAAHPDHRVRLVGNSWQVHLAARPWRRLCRLERGVELLEQDRVKRHDETKGSGKSGRLSKPEVV